MFGAISFVPLFAQGALGASATEAGSLLTPLMLSWVTLSVVGGRLLLKVGYKRTCIAGFAILTFGFVLLALFQRTSPRALLYFDLMLIGAGLGLSMLTLLIVVQQAVPSTQLGIATSLNQFSRSIGGAVGVAVMGAVLSAGLASNLEALAKGRPDVLAPEAAAKLAEDPNALIDPKSRAALSSGELEALQSSMAKAIERVFWSGAVFSALALLAVLWLPERLQSLNILRREEAGSSETGERMLIAEMATLEPEDQPVASSD
jgi:MFS family permease